MRPAIGGETGQFSPIVRYAFDTVEDVLRPKTIRLLVLSGAIVGAAVAAIWTMLRPGTIWLRASCAGAAVSALGVYLSHLGGNGAWLGPTLALLTVAGIVCVSMLPLRLWNYRLTRRAVVPLAGTKPGPGVPRIDVNAPFAGSKLAPGCCAKPETIS